MSIELPPLRTIPAGGFRMGTPDVERSALAKRYGGTRESYAEESPQHTVELPTYAIARIPVTHALYAEFVAVTGARLPIVWKAGRPPAHLLDHPVVDVSWDETQDFCRWLAAQTGTAWRLPTEAEWEKAARGTDGWHFPWGDEFAADHTNTRENGLGTTTPVGQFLAGASPYDILDLAGNVWEWTQSLQAPYPYADDGRNSATPARRWWQRPAPAGDARRVLRGGCYANPQGFARCACRFRLPPDRSTPFAGFRLATSLP